MKLGATILNAAWGAISTRATARFLLALRDPAAAQAGRLRHYVSRNATTAFGREHRLERVGGYKEFVRRVPLSEYESLQPWIGRIRSGEQHVLTQDRVTHLMPTSGSASARKLIPFTRELQKEVGGAVGAWIAGMFWRRPGLVPGPAYWSITPVLDEADAEPSAVPIGFTNDADYLGRTASRLIHSILAVPNEVRFARTIEAFRYASALSLLRCRDLRLISVWHPSFLSLLLDFIGANWDALLLDVANGSFGRSQDFPASARARWFTRPDALRARELDSVGPDHPARLWPRLAVVSCWAHGPAELSACRLRNRLGAIVLEPKGLIATEAFISFPFAGEHPLAVNTHFFEFLSADGRVCLADALQQGEEYEVVVTTGGGLWRYKLGDRIRVTGLLGKTPSVRFLGRGNNISDQCGEKLSETFVADAMRDTFSDRPPVFALLAPDDHLAGLSYTLYVEGAALPQWTEALDARLRKNPHYAWCRDLGQLHPMRLFEIEGCAYEQFARRQAARGARLGDIKPAVLSKHSGWSTVFRGRYAEAEPNML